MAVSRKPVPVPGAGDAPYWEGLRNGQLVLPRCTSCGWYTQRLQMACPGCRGEEFQWEQVSGRGWVYTYTVARQTWVAGFEDELPYVIVAVSLAEQPSLFLTTNLVGDFQIDDLDIGLPVVAEFEARGDQTLLQFRLDRRPR
jgi:uncharacterized OB-fold protein